MPGDTPMVDTRTALALAVALATTKLPPRRLHVREAAPDGPQAGDLVVEVTGMRAADPDAIGWLVGEGMAPYGEDDPLDGSVPMRHVWDVIPLSGAKGLRGREAQRWENAEFVKVPDGVLLRVPGLAGTRPVGSN